VYANFIQSRAKASVIQSATYCKVTLFAAVAIDAEGGSLSVILRIEFTANKEWYRSPKPPCQAAVRSETDSAELQTAVGLCDAPGPQQPFVPISPSDRCQIKLGIHSRREKANTARTKAFSVTDL